MSYLLTEIALEMLGYKYYDIDGAPGQTNFQGGPRADSTEPVEETLEGLLGFSRKPPSQRNNINCNDTRIKTITTEPASFDMDIESTQSNGLPSTHNQGKSENLKLTKRPNEDYMKQLDIEYKRIAEQIQRHKLHYTQANVRFAKSIERGTTTTQEFLQPFIRQEKENLEKEMQVMCDFRKLVERGISRVNPVVLETYHGVFNPNHSPMDPNDQSRP